MCSVLTAFAVCAQGTADFAAVEIIAEEAVSNGTVGEAVFWQMEGDTLTLSGTGKVEGFSNWGYEVFDCPWESYREQICHVVVEEGITELGTNLFAYLPNLETVSLPQSLRTIGSLCFAGDPALTQINIPERVSMIPERAFSGTTQLLPDGYTGLGFQFFCDTYLMGYIRTDQTTVTVPDGIVTIGYECFARHSEIQEIILPDSVKMIDSSAFDQCENLRKITFSKNLKTIAPSAFFRCTSLSQVTLPEGLEEIGMFAFGRCTGLSFFTMPETVTEIGQSAFFSCTELTRISLSDHPAESGEFVLPDHLTSVSNYLFEGCTKLKKITLPSACQRIGSGAFEDCTALAECVIPDTCQSIEGYAFSGCTALEQIEIPTQLHALSMSAFAGCTAIQMPEPVDGFYHLNEQYLYQYDGRNSVLTIPEQTTLIADSALRGRENLIEVICPESLRYLNRYCFEGCKYLTSVQLNDGLLEIGRDALSGCPYLTTLTIPASVTTIETQWDCSLKDIYGVSGTAAEQFALENGIAFHDIAENPPKHGTDMQFDYTVDGWSFGNSSEAFNSEYYLTEEDLAAVKAMTGKAFYEGEWGGSCFGLSLTVVLAKNGLIPLEQLQHGAKTLSDIMPTQQVQSMINYYHAVQYASAYINATGMAASDSHIRHVWTMVRLAENIKNGESPFLLEFSLGSSKHAVVGYGAESGAWTYNGKTYDSRILVWDSNIPDVLYDDACLYYDSLTLDYCIPFYHVQYSSSNTAENVGGVVSFCNDMSVLNAYPYPFAESAPAGDVNGDGVLSVADAVLLSRLLAEDTTAEPADWSVADMDADGLLTVLDVRALLLQLGI